MDGDPNTNWRSGACQAPCCQNVTLDLKSVKDFGWIFIRTWDSSIPGINITGLIPKKQKSDWDTGISVIAMGHPFGLPFSVTKGIISGITGKESEIFYLQHDAALNPGNSGGPLLDEEGRVLGINTFTIENGQSIGFALPIHIVESIIEEFLQGKGKKATRCTSCRSVVFEDTPESQALYCPLCGGAIHPISRIVPFEPLGVSRVLEEVLKEMGFEIDLIRKGPDHWMLVRGSANIEISYHEKTGLISAEAYLCRLPKTQVDELYEYILRQNNVPGALTYSVKDDMVLLSFLLYDQFLHGGLIGKYLENLFRRADETDEILIQRYGALPIEVF